eukprot:12070976-Alexandrium_andersonii.AAC.1
MRWWHNCLETQAKTDAAYTLPCAKDKPCDSLDPNPRGSMLQRSHLRVSVKATKLSAPQLARPLF